jgi:putative transposase
MVRRQLEYKGRWYRTHVVAVDRFYPSTQRCHDRRYKNMALTLSERTWHCPQCGVLHDGTSMWPSASEMKGYGYSP